MFPEPSESHEGEEIELVFAAGGSEEAAQTTVRRSLSWPTTLVDFLCNIHVVMREHIGRLGPESFEAEYACFAGRRCPIRHDLRCEDGLAVEFSRLPHLFRVEETGAELCVAIMQAPHINKDQFQQEGHRYCQDLFNNGIPIAQQARVLELIARR